MNKKNQSFITKYYACFLFYILAARIVRVPVCLWFWIDVRITNWAGQEDFFFFFFTAAFYGRRGNDKAAQKRTSGHRETTICHSSPSGHLTTSQGGRHSHIGHWVSWSMANPKSPTQKTRIFRLITPTPPLHSAEDSTDGRGQQNCQSNGNARSVNSFKILKFPAIENFYIFSIRLLPMPSDSESSPPRAVRPTPPPELPPRQPTFKLS